MNLDLSTILEINKKPDVLASGKILLNHQLRPIRGFTSSM
jgi:hypothetical protein